MFGLTATELRLAFYGVLLALISAALVYERYQGYESCRAPEKAAVKAEKAKDTSIDQGAVREDQQHKGSLTAPGGVASTPPPRIVCPSGRLPARSASGTAQPGEPASASSDRGMPRGAQAEPPTDYGPILQDFALAGVLRAAQGDELWERDVKEAQR